MGISSLFTGDVAVARAQLDQAIALYDPAEHRPLATRFGVDSRVSILSFRSLALWLLGYPEAALTDANDALKNAREMGQAATLMLASVIDLIYERRPPFNPSEVIEEIAALLKSYRCGAVTGDRYAAEFVVEAFRKSGITYRASKLDRSEVYGDFLPLVTAGRVLLLDHARAIAQFAALERRTFPSGKDRIDHPVGGHDDLSNAIAGAAVLASQDREQVIPLVAAIILPLQAPDIFGKSATAAFYEYYGIQR